MHQAGAESGEIEMTKEQLVKLLRTGRTDVDKQEPTRVIAHRIEDMNEKDLREAVIEFVYSR
jgi:hypothetical protein